MDLPPSLLHVFQTRHHLTPAQVLCLETIATILHQSGHDLTAQEADAISYQALRRYWPVLTLPWQPRPMPYLSTGRCPG